MMFRKKNIYVLLIGLLLLVSFMIICTIEDQYLIKLILASLYIIIFGLIIIQSYHTKKIIKASEKRARDKHNQSCLDSMTNLYNRRGFEEYGKSKWANAQTKQQSAAIMLIDIDKLKYLNDTYGHLIGDIAINKSASIVKHNIKLGIDIGVRFGGDEYLVLFTNIQVKELINCAEKIIKKVKETKIKEIKEDLSLSIGIAYIENASHLANIEDLINLSDQTLYEIKGTGGNKYKLTIKK